MKRWAVWGPVVSLVIALAICAMGFTDAVHAASESPTTLRFIFSGTSETEKAWSVRAKARIEALLPDVRIEYMYIPWADLEQKIAVMLQAGDVPDLVLTQDLTNLVAMGALEPLDDRIDAPNSKVQRSQWYPSAWEYSIIDGRTYSIPLAAIAYGLVVREDYLREAGIDYRDIKTWDDLVDAAAKTTKPPRYGYGYAAGVPRFAWRDPSIAAWSNGQLALNDVSDARRAAYLETLELYRTLRPFMPQAVVAWSYPEMFRAYALGQLAMIPVGTYFTANVYPISPDSIQYSRAIVFPQGPSATRPAAMVTNVGVAMFRGSKHKEAAWKVLEILTDVESVTSWSALVNMPARRDVLPEQLAEEAKAYYPEAHSAHSRILSDFGEVVNQYGVPAPRILNQAEMEVAFQAQMVQMLQGRITPTQMYEALRRQLPAIGR